MEMRIGVEEKWEWWREGEGKRRRRGYEGRWGDEGRVNKGRRRQE